MALLRLIRWPNLLIIFFTQLLTWRCVIFPIREFHEITLVLNWGNFLLLSCSTMLIAAAGYIINDYFDIRIDNINRPEKLVLEKKIPRRMGIIMHNLLNVAGLFFAGIVAVKAGHLSLLSWQLSCTILLWFYSTQFKRKFIIGNLVVALLTALTIIILVFYEPALYFYLTQPPILNLSGDFSIPNPVWVLIIYGCFAFILTWMREIVKDMEDYKGDMAEGCLTMPIKWGLRKTIRFTQVLGVFTIFPLIIFGYKLLQAKDWWLGIYLLLALAVPLFFWIFYLQKKITTNHFGKASRGLKFIMVAGIGSLIIYYFEANA